MDIPRFCRGAIAANMWHGDGGEEFQSFVGELLNAEQRLVHTYPTGGRDGGIDIVEQIASGRIVHECKFVGIGEPYRKVQQRWRASAQKFRLHLSQPQPTQAQYSPWYHSERPIRKYVFCVSYEFANDSQRERLREEISRSFADLRTGKSHLAHLAELACEIVDWNDIRLRLANQEHLIYRWFPNLIPQGLFALEHRAHSGFASYLSAHKLAYYSLAQHISKYPLANGQELSDEHQLTNALEENRIVGIVITGAGGVGKTRLSLEVARLCQDASWVVFWIGSGFSFESLRVLRQRVRPERPILLVADYAETDRNFADVVRVIEELNRAQGCRVHLIATSRSTYWPAISDLPLQRVALDDPHLKEWYGGYKKAVVEHILAQAGLDFEAEHANLPVLATFLAYAAEQHPELKGELQNIRDVDQFARWVRRRLEMTMGNRWNETSLAFLVACLPLQTSSFGLLGLSDVPFLEYLAQDGWINNEEGAWRMVHDVLADRILLGYLEPRSETMEHQVEMFLDFSAKIEAVRSALISLERIADTNYFGSLSWGAPVIRSLDKNPRAFSSAQAELATFSLISPMDRLALLRNRPDYWRGAEELTGFQNAIAWLIRWALRDPVERTTQEQIDLLTTWIDRCLPHVKVSNFLLTWCLRLDPVLGRQPAMLWFERRPTAFQTHYLLVAWLEQKLDPEDVRGAIAKWLNYGPNRFLPAASFIYTAWLEAAREETTIDGPFRDWLSVPENRTRAEARFPLHAWLAVTKDCHFITNAIGDWLSVPTNGVRASAGYLFIAWLEAQGDPLVIQTFLINWFAQADNRMHERAGDVYMAWLDANGDPEIVREPIKGWLAHGENEISANAEYVYRAWLQTTKDHRWIETSFKRWFDIEDNRRREHIDRVCRMWLESGGEFTAVKGSLIDWLHAHRDDHEAVYVTKALAGQPDLPLECVVDIIHWCTRFASDEDASWRLSRLRANLWRPEVVSASVGAIEAICANVNAETVRSSESALAIWILLSNLRSAAKRMPGVAAAADQALFVWSQRPDPDAAFTFGLRALEDFEIPPNIWSSLWEIMWQERPAHLDLVGQGLRWLRFAPTHPAWTYVWEPLFLAAAADGETVDVAHWWLEMRGPRDRGAWAWVWMQLWDKGHRKVRTTELGWAWIAEFGLRPHKYWWDVWDRLRSANERLSELDELAVSRSQVEGLKRIT